MSLPAHPLTRMAGGLTRESPGHHATTLWGGAMQDLREDCREAIRLIDATGVKTETPSWLTDVVTLGTTVEAA